MAPDGAKALNQVVKQALTSQAAGKAVTRCTSLRAGLNEFDVQPVLGFGRLRLASSSRGSHASHAVSWASGWRIRR